MVANRPRFTTMISVALLGAAMQAGADGALEDLDAPMTVFETPGEVAGIVAGMPRPDADPRGAAYNDAAPEEVDDLTDDELVIGPDRDTKREIQAQYDRELVDRVREGFVAAPTFEGANRDEERLGAREDFFHFEEGEDVDVEDGFNDEDEIEADDPG